MKYEQLVDAWLDAVKQQHSVDYSDTQSVEATNSCTDRYREIATLIDETYPEKLTTFSTFLESEDACVRVACAICLLELTHYPKELEAKALDVIKKHTEDSWDAFGYILWLDDWYQGKISTKYTLKK